MLALPEQVSTADLLMQVLWICYHLWSTLVPEASRIPNLCSKTFLRASSAVSPRLLTGVRLLAFTSDTVSFPCALLS